MIKETDKFISDCLSLVSISTVSYDGTWGVKLQIGDVGNSVEAYALLAPKLARRIAAVMCKHANDLVVEGKE